MKVLKGGNATDKGEEVLAVKASPKLLEALDRIAPRITQPGQKPLSRAQVAVFVLEQALGFSGPGGGR